ncbi:lysozyme inhibitor LprI family protein [Roseomonas haemaphysalidis]|nr:lysozyme inhibitor LprI family protein [Roseomonas haemaphysalidis]
MSMIRMMTLAALALLAAGPALAAGNCADASTQGAANACAARELAAADARLNATYNQVVGRLKAEPEARAALLEAQRAWIRFRDGECAFATVNARGGSVAPFLDARCQTRMTEARLQQLQDYLSCGEGEMDCPVPAGR